MAGYIGPTPVPQATQNREAFTAVSTQTTFNTSGYTPGFLDVYLNGVKLAAADFTATNGSDVVLASGAAAGDILEVVSFTAFEILNQSFSGTTTVVNLTATGTTTLAGASTSANITFGDNDKAIFGAGSDLQIYHDGANSYIDDAGTGGLIVRADNFYVRKANDVENMIIGSADGAVTLYHDNSTKLATTSTGVDITGTLTSDGLTVHGSQPIITLSDPDTGSTSTISGNSGHLILNADSGSDASNNTIDFQVDNSQKMRLDASGNLLVGKTVTSSNTAGGRLSNIGSAEFTRSGGQCLYLNRQSSDGTISSFAKDGTTVGSIGTNGGRLSIGSGDVNLNFNASANSMYPISDTSGTLSDGVIDVGAATARFKDLYLSNSVKVITATNGTSIIDLGDTADSDIGRIAYDNSVNAMYFKTNNSEAMRIDSSARLLVGKTGQGLSNAGFEVEQSGQTSVTQSGASCIRLNRLSSDGDIIQLRKDTSQVGSIGTSGGDLIIGTGDTGLKFFDGSNSIFPVDQSSGNNRDNAVDIGFSSVRFKDLYLSGGVFLGGTGSANKLDDYEEGTFTPTITFGNNNTGMTFSTRGGFYTKVGQLVTVMVEMTLSAKGSSTGTVKYEGLPFTAKAGTQDHCIASQMIRRVPSGEDTIADLFHLFVVSNATHCILRSTISTGDGSPGDGNYDDDTRVSYTLSYLTDA